MIANNVVETQAPEATHTDEITRRSVVLKALGDPNRLRILYLLRKGEMCVSDLLPYFEINQPTVSIHLKRLVELGLISVRREGRRRYYRLIKKELLECVDRF